jgi:hypothetical protein
MGKPKAVFTVEIETEGRVPTEKELVRHIESAVPASRLEDFRIKGVSVVSVRTPEHFNLAEELCELAQKHGVEEGALDELVHDAQASEAADANNGGIEEQIGYLVGDSTTAPNLKETRKQVVEAVRENATVGMVECVLCGDKEFAEIAHIDRDKQQVCDECWDERLR